MKMEMFEGKSYACLCTEDVAILHAQNVSLTTHDFFIFRVSEPLRNRFTEYGPFLSNSLGKNIYTV